MNLSRSPILVLELKERRRARPEPDATTKVDRSVAHLARAMSEPGLTRAQALFAILWQGADTRKVRRCL